jgi:hypothetical protein
MDIARADGACGKLGGLISPRASQDRRPDPEKREELWKASARPYNALRREKMRAAGKKYLQGQPERHRAILEALRARHEEEAAKLMDIEPKGAT